MKLAFYKAKGTFFNALIRHNPIAGSGPYSHVELALGGPLENALCYSASNRNPCGVRLAHIDLTNGNWDLADVGLTPEQEAKVLDFCTTMSTRGLKYDWSGILGFVLPFGEHCDADRFCSEACVEALQQVGLLSTVKRWLVSPNGLYLLITAKP